MIRRWTRNAVVLTCSLAMSLACEAVLAQTESQTAAEVGNAAQLAADLLQIPDSPAFTFLRLSPSRISRPGSTRDLALELLNGFDEEGRVRQGFALEISPSYVFSTGGISLKEYQENDGKYVLENLRLSLGTVRTAGDSAATDFALGLRLKLLDRGDPMRNRAFTQRVGDLLLQALPSPEAGPDAEPDSVALGRELRQHRTGWTRAHWNAYRLEMAGVAGMRLANSEIDRGRFSGAAAWIAGSIPFGDFGQILLHLQYDYRRRIATQPSFSRLTYGGRFLFGSHTFNGFVEVAGESKFDTRADLEDASGSWSLGIEKRVASSLWITTGFGSRFDTLERADKIVLLGGIRWGILSQARLDPRT